jgi:hypothetical protein
MSLSIVGQTHVPDTLQADVLQAWLSSNPARQEAQRKEGGDQQQSKKIELGAAGVKIERRE